MSLKRQKERRLLVEGEDDKRVLPFLIESNGVVKWESDNTPFVEIFACGSVDEVLKPGFIGSQFQGSDLKALGVIVDADLDANACWRRIKTQIQVQYPNAPDLLPAKGVVLHEAGSDLPKFGAWVMPDNINRGMLETFLLHLRPASNTALLELSEKVVDLAKNAGATFIDAHRDKVQIHSWLAWQDPPGRQMHDSIKQRMLTEKSQLLTDFLDWFCELYDCSIGQ
jgi:hypothetical protein